MKKIIICVSILFVSLFPAKAQNADPYISISMNPPTLTLGTNGVLEILEGNFAFDPICPNSLIMTISVGPNAEILGIGPGSDTRWVQFGPLIPGPANTIQMTNAAGGFGVLDLAYVYLTVKAVALGGPANIGGNIAYIIANNPCAGGAPNSIQGNANTSNDNGTTSLLVSPALPLNFSGFNVKDKGCSGLVSWSTADEQNVKNFEVQQSFDGNNYSVVKTVASKGNGSHTYEVEVTQSSKRMYYRVVGVDMDNRRSYGTVLVLQLANCTKAAIVQVYPIPAYRDQQVTMQTNVNDKISYRLIDISGKVVQTGMFVRTKQLAVVVSGTYLLEMTSANFKETQKIVIQ